MNFTHYLRRNLGIQLMLVFLIVFFTSAAMAEVVLVPGDELLTDGEFSGPLKFNLYKESGGNAEIGIADEELEINVNKIGSVSHAIQPYYDGFKLFKGVEYILSFDVRATMPRDLFVRIQLNGGDYHAYFEQLIDVTEEKQHFSFPFVMAESSDPAPRLCVNMGFTDTMAASGLQPDDIVPHKVYFDNFSLTIGDISGLDDQTEETKIEPIRFNQVGYLPDAPKTAVFADFEGDNFSVISANTGRLMLQGKLSAPVDNTLAGETDRIADFSSLTEPGMYKLKGPDGSKSTAFAVDGQVYDTLLRSLLKMLYLQRCGTELDAEHADIYAHPVCHSDQALIYGTDQLIDVSGGWHDAGDYGRYIVSGAKAAADLLLSYEMNSGLIDDAGIPESGDGIDDRLQEVRYELDWMLKMQAENGGVYHKVTGYNFPGFIKPQDETEQMIVSPISNTATGDFAGVLALAARVFSESGSPELASAAEDYIGAAERAWEYLEAHQDDPGFTNPPDIVTGEYPDSKDSDERFWAAAELARTTGKEEYREAAAALLARGQVTSEFGWVEMGGYGLYAILTDPERPEDDELRVSARDMLSSAVKRVSAVIESNPYAINRTDAFEWGSNMGVANDGILLLLGASVYGEDGLRDKAYRQLDYLLGENVLDICFVTGNGRKSPVHPHHRPSQAFGAPVPGMLVGGPNSNLEDPYMLSAGTDCTPASCYADSDQSYSTNETAVYWNSPLILLISGLTARP